MGEARGGDGGRGGGFTVSVKRVDVIKLWDEGFMVEELKAV